MWTVERNIVESHAISVKNIASLCALAIATISNKMEELGHTPSYRIFKKMSLCNIIKKYKTFQLLAESLEKMYLNIVAENAATLKLFEQWCEDDKKAVSNNNDTHNYPEYSRFNGCNAVCHNLHLYRLSDVDAAHNYALQGQQRNLQYQLNNFLSLIYRMDKQFHNISKENYFS